MAEHLSLIERLSFSGRFSVNPPYFGVLDIIVNIACILQSFNNKLKGKYLVVGLWYTYIYYYIQLKNWCSVVCVCSLIFIEITESTTEPMRSASFT